VDYKIWSLSSFSIRCFVCHFSQGLLLFMELVMEKRERKSLRKKNILILWNWAFFDHFWRSHFKCSVMLAQVFVPILNHFFVCVCRNFRGKLQNVYLHQREWRKRQRGFFCSHFGDFSFYIRLNWTGTFGLFVFLGFQTRSETQDLFTST